MKFTRNLSLPVGKVLSFSALTFLFAAGSAQSALYLAFGVSTNSNEAYVLDLHNDHYHIFSVNNGTPGGHTPVPFTITPGATSETFELGSMDISPYPINGLTTNLDPAGDFHLELHSLLGPGATNLEVLFWHDDHTHTMSVGGEEHLELTEVNSVEFRLPEGAELGDYSATFSITDESGNYVESSAFTINVTAIPEPSTVFLSLLGTLALVRRKR
ncbi:MAG: PEP-CTERM sorting domain-containing protein [Verrucomicrobiota bacterium JB023]|nr:PEP-CTERM sorting domain-containing protein [Verrucomicrobiota bacterium JB023]